MSTCTVIHWWLVQWKCRKEFLNVGWYLSTSSWTKQCQFTILYSMDGYHASWSATPPMTWCMFLCNSAGNKNYRAHKQEKSWRYTKFSPWIKGHYLGSAFHRRKFLCKCKTELQDIPSVYNVTKFSFAALSNTDLENCWKCLLKCM